MKYKRDFDVLRKIPWNRQFMWLDMCIIRTKDTISAEFIGLCYKAFRQSSPALKEEQFTSDLQSIAKDQTSAFKYKKTFTEAIFHQKLYCIVKQPESLGTCQLIRLLLLQ